MELREPGAPALAADGRIAFTVSAVYTEPGRSERSRIWVLPADRSPAQEVTRGDGVDAQPAWSPDGRVLAFVSDRRQAGQPGLHVLEPGSEARAVGGPPGSVEGLA